ncbi:MAG: ligase-associated DNA damage response exonuclease [Flavobacteriales bacterium]|nr:MAG: ligase-associated DNA damage response exonuclease [Flavobacteriales bacterium]
MPLLELTERGLFCGIAGVYIDPWRPVERALITHAHADHSRYGHKHYLAHHHSLPIMKHRLGDIRVQGIEYAEKIVINNVAFSFHPAGHIPGSAQIRVEYKGEVWVVSGDYKLEYDGISTPFESVKCDCFITESTFGLPVYQWQLQQSVFDEINAWWASNAEQGIASVLTGYSLGKAQRLLANVNPEIGPIYTHGAVDEINQLFELNDIVEFPATMRVQGSEKKSDYRRALIVAPPSVQGSSWLKKLQPYSLGMASGWMALRGIRRRRSADRGFVLSDHADWNGLNRAIRESGAQRVLVTHGYSSIFSRWLRDQGYDAQPLKTEFGDEETADS